MKVYLEALVGWYFQCDIFFNQVYVVVQFHPLFQTHYHVLIIHYHPPPPQKKKTTKFKPWIKLSHNICIHYHTNMIYCTFKLINVNTVPNSPPIMPIITVGMNARIFKPMPWLICNETNISAWCVLSWAPLEGCGCVYIKYRSHSKLCLRFRCKQKAHHHR